MPTYAEVQHIIEDRFTQLWSATPVSFANVPSLKYSDANNPPLAEGSDPYLSVRVMYGESEAMEIVANPVKRTYGSLAIDLYSKKDGGTLTNNTNMDALATLFEYQKISGVVFRQLVTMESKALGSWFVTPILIRFHFDR